MTFWQFVTNCFNWFEGRTTRIIGLAGGTISVLLASDVIPAKDAKFCMAAVAVFTYWRGQAITKRVDTANAIIASQPNGMKS